MAHLLGQMLGCSAQAPTGLAAALAPARAPEVDQRSLVLQQQALQIPVPACLAVLQWVLCPLALLRLALRAALALVAPQLAACCEAARARQLHRLVWLQARLLRQVRPALVSAVVILKTQAWALPLSAMGWH